MSDAWGLGGKFSQDPIGSKGEKSLSLRKSGRDLGLTPTEQRQKAQLMRQFLKRDGQQGSTEAFRSAECWCDCGRGLKGDAGLCSRCEAAFMRGDLG